MSEVRCRRMDMGVVGESLPETCDDDSGDELAVARPSFATFEIHWAVRRLAAQLAGGKEECAAHVASSEIVLTRSPWLKETIVVPRSSSNRL